MSLLQQHTVLPSSLQSLLNMLHLMLLLGLPPQLFLHLHLGPLSLSGPHLSSWSSPDPEEYFGNDSNKSHNLTQYYLSLSWKIWGTDSQESARVLEDFFPPFTSLFLHLAACEREDLWHPLRPLKAWLSN